MSDLGKTLAELGLSIDRGLWASVTGIAVDSRDVKPGYLFAALPGSKIHGAAFITYALRQGASAILTDIEGAKLADELELTKLKLRHEKYLKNKKND